MADQINVNQQATHAFIRLKWELLEACHNKLIDLIGEEKQATLLPAIDKSGIFLALAYADYRCQAKGCGSSEKLTIQHLIRDPDKKFMDEDRFYKAKLHWRNLIVLCAKCHTLADRIVNAAMAIYVGVDDMGYIDPEQIKAVRDYFNSSAGPMKMLPVEITQDAVDEIKDSKMTAGQLREYLKTDEAKRAAEILVPKKIKPRVTFY